MADGKLRMKKCGWKTAGEKNEDENMWDDESEGK